MIIPLTTFTSFIACVGSLVPPSPWRRQDPSDPAARRRRISPRDSINPLVIAKSDKSDYAVEIDSPGGVIEMPLNTFEEKELLPYADAGASMCVDNTCRTCRIFRAMILPGRSWEPSDDAIDDAAAQSVYRQLAARVVTPACMEGSDCGALKTLIERESRLARAMFIKYGIPDIVKAGGDPVKLLTALEPSHVEPWSISGARMSRIIATRTLRDILEVLRSIPQYSTSKISDALLLILGDSALEAPVQTRPSVLTDDESSQLALFTTEPDMPDELRDAKSTAYRIFVAASLPGHPCSRDEIESRRDAAVIAIEYLTDGPTLDCLDGLTSGCDHLRMLVRRTPIAMALFMWHVLGRVSSAARLLAAIEPPVPATPHPAPLTFQFIRKAFEGVSIADIFEVLDSIPPHSLNPISEAVYSLAAMRGVHTSA